MLFLFPVAGEKSSGATNTPVHESKASKKRPIGGGRGTPPQTRTPPRTPPHNRSKTPPVTSSLGPRHTEAGSLNSSTSSYSSASHRENTKKFSGSDTPSR